MQKKDIKIPSSEGKTFDCYVVTPDTKVKVPAIVLTSAIHGVDEDIRDIADSFAMSRMTSRTVSRRAASWRRRRTCSRARCPGR